MIVIESHNLFCQWQKFSYQVSAIMGRIMNALKIILADLYTRPILGPLVPLFWISGDVSSGFQSQNGLPYLHSRGKHNVMYSPWDPPLVLLLPTSCSSFSMLRGSNFPTRFFPGVCIHTAPGWRGGAMGGGGGGGVWGMATQQLQTAYWSQFNSVFIFLYKNKIKRCLLRKARNVKRWTCDLYLNMSCC